MNTKTQRYYYIDLIRGIAFILMAIDHLFFDIVYFFSSYWKDYFSNKHYLNVIANAVSLYRKNDISNIFRFLFIASVFLFISGVSSTLSRNIVKRGVRVLIISLLITLITFIIYLITGSKSIIIYFGILHCISVCMLLTPQFKKLDKRLLFMLAIIIIFLGFYFGQLKINTFWLIPFNITGFAFTTADYYPIFPYMGIYILGLLFGSWYFNKKKNIKSPKEYKMNIFTYFGKNALVWYFIHQAFLIVFLVLFTLINLIFV